MLDFEHAPAEFDKDRSESEPEPQPRKRRRRSPKRLSPLHEARIDEYRARIEGRGWIFCPPSPELPISALFEHLTTKQIVGLGSTTRRLA